jgi:TRAP-type C4-dicarboxylate transport system substrate-binding protein
MPTRNEAVLMMTSLYLTEGLRRTLLELVQAKGDEGLNWLRDFEDELVRDAKGSGVDGVPIEDEAAIMRGAIEFLGFIFDDIRREIADKTK